MAPPELVLHTSATRFDGYSRSSPRTRSLSLSSDRPSLTGFSGLQSPPASTSPDPAFIAASAASQIVTNDHDSHSEAWFDQHGIEPSGETALVSPPALKLVNRFLDQLLLNFLSISRSTSLASLRPAVGEVLKTKLAKDAINGADQELQEYLGGGEDEELNSFHNGTEPNGDWDLELIWKRTRLRCMVYSSLGDMEEEDEDFYTEQEQLDGPPGSNNRFSNNSGVVSPAVAIFLTSILEFMGEQVLVVAGQAAYHRLRAKLEKEERDGAATPTEIADRVIVEEADMERVALDRTLGRLWRGWKKRIRSPTTSVSMSRSFSRESLLSQPQTSRRASVGPDEQIAEDEDAQTRSLAAVLAEHEHAAGIPLPMSSQDVREIEIPGLAIQSDDEEAEEHSSEDEALQIPKRPTSLIYMESTSEYLESLSKSKKRPSSLPTPAPSAYYSPKILEPTSKKVNEEDDTNPVKSEALAGDSVDNSRQEVNDDMAAPEPAEPKSLVAGVVAGAAAIGSAAIVGLAAAARGEAPQTFLAADEETEGEEDLTEEDLIEEPQILTSSRISVALSGGISPDENGAPSRQSSIRSYSHSVHSLRLIDVTSPRSPPISRTSSAERRPLSIHSPLIMESQIPRNGSPVLKTLNGSPLMHNGSSLSTRQKRNSAEEVISEEQEKEPGVGEGDDDDDVSPPMTAVPADLAAAMAGVDFYPSPTFPSESSSGESGHREQASREILPNATGFVLSAPPPARNAARLANKDKSMKDNQKSLQSSKSIENGGPSLTPLREMLEGVASTSDEAISGHDVRSVVSDQNSHVESSVTPVPRERVVRPQPNGLRSSPPDSINRKELPRHRKDSNPRTHQPVHASGSISSFTSHKIKPMRTSEDSGSKESGSTGGNKSQSFEQLIRSDETIQFTLTPQNMRKIEVCKF
jgi:hypothetical protein